MGTVSKMQLARDKKALMRLMADGKARDSQDIALAAGEGMGEAIESLFAAGKLIRVTWEGKISYRARESLITAVA